MAALGHGKAQPEGTIASRPRAQAQLYLAPLLPNSSRAIRVCVSICGSRIRRSTCSKAVSTSRCATACSTTAVWRANWPMSRACYALRPTILHAMVHPRFPRTSSPSLMAFRSLRTRTLVSASGERAEFSCGDHNCRVIIDDGASMRFAAMAGLGISTHADWNIDRALRDGSLVRVLPEWHVEDDTALAGLPQDQCPDRQGAGTDRFPRGRSVAIHLGRHKSDALPERLISMPIRPSPADHEAIWAILEPVSGAGESYAIDPDISREDGIIGLARTGNLSYSSRTAQSSGPIACAPMQAAGARTSAIAAITAPAAAVPVLPGKCLHSLDHARARSIADAVQLRGCNTRAIDLWETLGFTTVGTLPGAFNHPRHGMVDALVMYQSL